MRNKKAYPSQEIDLSVTDQFGGSCFYEKGMDLRDYFAAKAMQSMLTALFMENTKKIHLNY